MDNDIYPILDALIVAAFTIMGTIVFPWLYDATRIEGAILGVLVCIALALVSIERGQR